MLLTLSALLAVSAHAADTCFDRRMDCYLDVHMTCSGEALKADPNCERKLLPTCDRDFRCPGDAAPTQSPLNPGYSITPNVVYDDNCAPYRPRLDGQIKAAIARFQDCINYGFVKDDIAKRMVGALQLKTGVHVSCDEPARSTWCADAREGGYMRLSPSRMITPGSFCSADLGSYFIHEVGHLADLAIGPQHNEMGENGDFDEVYSMQSYCMRPARNWLFRAKRAVDIAQPERLDCVRDYQEMTPSTLRDPFWDEYRARVDAGVDPCPASLSTPAPAPAKPHRSGD